VQWERTSHSIVGTENEARGGMTSRCSCANSTHVVVILYAYDYSQLLVSITSGDYEWSSGWLDGQPQLASVATDQHIQEELKRSLQLVIGPSGKPTKHLTPLVLCCEVMSHIDHLLA